MIIIIKPPGKPAYAREYGRLISINLLHEIVGSFARVRYGPDGLAVVFNPKSRGDANFRLPSAGYIRGTAVFCGCDGEKLTGLTEKQQKEVWRWV